MSGVRPMLRPMKPRRFGFLKEYLTHHLFNSSKIKYCWHKRFGKLELPKDNSQKCINKMVKNAEKKKEYEKLINPFGLKPTIPYSWCCSQEHIDFVDYPIILFRNHHPNNEKQLLFRTQSNISKLEMKQYLTKIYKIPVEEIHSKMYVGKIQKRLENPHLRFRREDWKKFYIKSEHEIGIEHRSIKEASRR